jgi:flagellar biosynthesis protein FliQ
MVLVTVGAPLFGGMLAMGLFLGIMQSATQINDAAVGFVPRIMTALGLSWLLGGWMLHRLAAFFAASVMTFSNRG